MDEFWQKKNPTVLATVGSYTYVQVLENQTRAASFPNRCTVNRVATKLTSFYFALHTRSIFYQRKCKCLFQQAVGELDK